MLATVQEWTEVELRDARIRWKNEGWVRMFARSRLGIPETVPIHSQHNDRGE